MIQFKDVSLRFEKKHIFSKLNVEIKTNEKIIITGNSGSGKTSLFHLLLGFKIPTSGVIYFKNKPISSSTISLIRRSIAYIPQEINIGNGEVLSLIKSFFSFKANRHLQIDQNLLDDLLRLFQLDKQILKKDVSKLSGGEKQRIAIIISVLLKRNIFLLDEITSALDKTLKHKVANFFLNQDTFTVIAISHDEIWYDNDKCKIFNMETKQWGH